MINFDSSHQRTNESIKPNGKKLKNILVAGVLVSSMLLFTGCDKSPKSEADVSRIQQFVSEHVDPKCEISELHVHKLVSERGAITYGAREPDFYDRLKGNTFRFTMGGTESYERTNEYLIVSEEEYKLYEKLLRSGLISIKDNEGPISEYIELFSQFNPVIEYEYMYKKGGFNGKTPVSHTRYAWTNDSEHPSLTGERRIAYPVLYGYKIEKDDEGNYIKIKSEPYTDMENLINDGYTYIYGDFKIHYAYYPIDLKNRLEHENQSQDNSEMTEMFEEQPVDQIDEEKSTGSPQK